MIYWLKVLMITADKEPVKKLRIAFVNLQHHVAAEALTMFLKQVFVSLCFD